MSLRSDLIYVMSNCWVWPIVFFLRPLDVAQEAEKTERKWSVVACAILGGTIWGTIIGCFLWLWAGNISDVYIIAFGFVLAFAFVVAVAIAGAVPGAAAVAVGVAAILGVAEFFVDAAAIAVISNTAFAFTGAVAVAGAGTGVVARIIARVAEITGAGTGIITGAFCSSIYTILGCAGVYLGLWLPHALFEGGVLLFSAIFLLLCIFVILDKFSTIVEIPGAEIVTAILWIVGMPLSAFMLFSQAPTFQAHALGVTMAFSMFISRSAVFFMDKDGLSFSVSSQNISSTTLRQTNWLVFLWIIFPVLAFAAWFPDPDTPDLNEKLDNLSLCLILAPPLLTGLPLYPVIILISLWQCRDQFAREYSPEKFRLIAPFRWQSFAYPLPGIKKYLIRLAQYNGYKTAYDAIREIQFRSMQMRAGRLAVLDLARGETALPFCGYIAIRTNSFTLEQLSLAGDAARAVSVLWREQEKKKTLRIYAGKFPNRTTRKRKIIKKALDLLRIPIDPLDQNFLIIIGKTLINRGKFRIAYEKTLTDREKFIVARGKTLTDRIVYARDLLFECQPQTDHINAFCSLLDRLQYFSEVTDPRNALTSTPSLFSYDSDDPDMDWMKGGWKIIDFFHQFVDELKPYGELTSPGARKAFFNQKAENLKKKSGTICPITGLPSLQKFSITGLNCLKKNPKRPGNG